MKNPPRIPGAGLLAGLTISSLAALSPCFAADAPAPAQAATSSNATVAAPAAIATPAKVETPAAKPTTPAVGALAPNFKLKSTEGKEVELKQLTAKSPVVLLVLRGWPGYQCPICNAQVLGYIQKADEFKKRGAQVLMVYPGPADRLDEHALDFLKNKTLPAEYLFVTDPAYDFVNAYALRWDAPRETAYPSTFIIDKEGKVRFEHISHEHGDRISADAALKELDNLK